MTKQTKSDLLKVSETRAWHTTVRYSPEQYLSKTFAWWHLTYLAVILQLVSDLFQFFKKN